MATEHSRSHRANAWRLIIALKSFTTEEVAVGVGMSMPAATVLVKCMADAGLIQKINPVSSARKPYRYCLAAPAFPFPRVIDEVHYWQCQAWTAMRVKRRFTVDELFPAMREDVKEVISRQGLARWLRKLEAAGYIRHAVRSPSKPVVYQVVRFDSPEPPSADLFRHELREVADV